MNWRSRWIISAFVVAGLFVGVAPAYARQAHVHWVVVAPLALAGLIAAAILGVRRAPADRLTRRFGSAVIWSFAWAVLVAAPWAIRAGSMHAELALLPAPHDAAQFGRRLTWEDDGFSAGWQTETTRDELHSLYHAGLTSRGWRHVWTRDLSPTLPGMPPGVPIPTWTLYRRFDGTMLVTVGNGLSGETYVGAQYSHLGRPNDQYDHLFAPRTPPAGSNASSR